MPRCTVFATEPVTGELAMQCLNETEEEWDYADMIADVNQQWKDEDKNLKMTGNYICESHMDMLEDI